MAMRALGGLAIQTIKAIGAYATRAITTDVPDNTAVGGNARGANAVDLQTSRLSATEVASGANSVVLGAANTASGISSVAIGLGCGATGTGSLALGINSSDKGRERTIVHAAGLVSIGGDRQNIVSGILRGQTTSAAGVRLTSTGTAANAVNIINLTDSSAIFFRIMLLASVNNTSAKAWTIDGLLRRGVGVGTTTMPTAATIATVLGDAALSTATVACTADATNGGINLTVNGVAATTINWSGFVQAAEVAG